MFCKMCGRQMPSVAQFCPHCGESGESAGPFPKTAQTVDYVQAPGFNKASQRTFAFGSGAMVASILLVLVITIGWFAYRLYTSQPEYSLLKLRDAVEHHDLVDFQKYVDVDSVISNVVDQAISLTLQNAFDKNSQDSWEQFGALIGGGIASNLKPQFVSLFRTKLTELVEKGSFEVDGQRTDLHELENIRLQNKPTVRQEGDLAYVGLSFVNGRNGSSLSIELNMRKKDDHWQITELRNLSNLVERVRNLQAESASPKQEAHQSGTDITAQQNNRLSLSDEQAPARRVASTQADPKAVDSEKLSAAKHVEGQADAKDNQYSQEYNSCAKQAESEQGANSYTLALKDCYVEETVRQDARLNRVWKALTASLNEADKKALIVEERSWIKKKDRDCVPNDDGFATRLESSVCYCDMTKKRADQLQAKLTTN